MTKKHFEAIAQAMQATAPRIEWLNKRQQWRNDCRELSRTFVQFNPYFDRVRFLEACGINGVELEELIRY
jgi:hypothetical protein